MFALSEGLGRTMTDDMLRLFCEAKLAGFAACGFLMLPAFGAREEAIEYVKLIANDDCIDNLRFAFSDDDDAMDDYYSARDLGCCGFVDIDIVVGGRMAIVGCNYGH